MKKTILGVFLFSLTLCAADLTGAWTGTLKMKRDDGSDGSDSAYLVLKQQGNTVTGTAGGDVNEQHPIQDGKLEGDLFTFVITRDNGSIRISLKLQPDGNTMTGNIQRERNGQTQTAQLEVKRNQ